MAHRRNPHRSGAQYEFGSEEVNELEYTSEPEVRQDLHSDAPGHGLHPGVKCDGCEADIRGIRFKCVTCPDYDLCTACEGTGLHTEHDMTQMLPPGQQTQQPVVEADDILHPGIWCDSCDVNIRGIRYKCMICPDYDLCSRCEGQGHHMEHDMTEIRTPVSQRAQGILHPGITCDGCGVAIRGVRFMCMDCPDYDLCSACESQGFHKEHNLSPINTPISNPQLRGILHPGIVCDSCDNNIRGVRFKCKVCPDYDLCLLCKRRDFHSEHDMKAIRRPGRKKPHGRQCQGVPHPGIWCDSCDVNIRGVRFKCTMCPDYDLCSICEEKGYHREHQKLAIHRPNEPFNLPPQFNPALIPDEPQEEIHPGVSCDVCMGNIRGVRYKCRVCPDYDLCSICMGNRLHPEHSFLGITYTAHVTAPSAQQSSSQMTQPSQRADLGAEVSAVQWQKT